jgi:hypothetical protein
MYWWVEKQWFIGYADFPNMLHGPVTHQSHMEVFFLRRFDTIILKFSKILIFSWELEFNHWQQLLSVVFLEVCDPLCLFSRKHPSKTVVWISIVGVLSASCVFKSKVLSRKLAGVLTLQYSLCCFAWDTWENLVRSRSAPVVISVLSHRH